MFCLDGKDIMAVTLFCPSLKCRSILQVPDGVRGKKVRCGNCGTTFIVPAKPETAGAPAVPQEAPDPEKQDTQESES